MSLRNPEMSLRDPEMSLHPKERAVKDYLLYTVRITPLYSPQGGKYFCI